MKWYLEKHRAFQSSTVRVGPFDSKDDACAFATRTGLQWALVPLIDPASFADTPAFWMDPYAEVPHG